MAKPDIESTIYLRSSISHAKPRNPARTYLVYFITGNPGLIEYYRTFLTHLYGLLSTSSSSSSSSSSIHSPNFHIFGRSLSGFEVDDVCSKDKSTGFPYSLREQITRSGNALKELAGDLKGKDGRQPKVILVGHSVGSYILLELIRELREGLARGGEVDVGVDVVGGICLFPTVVDIARSNSGRSGGTLLRHPRFALSASLFARALLFFVPLTILRFLIQMLMGFPEDAATVTAAFAKSEGGIRQALHMARDEMFQITSDTWDDEIWGAAHPSFSGYPRPVLRFLFGQKDHWVADETRDDLIKARGQNGKDEHWKPKMEVDEEEGWPHGFCIKHSIPVAERVKDYVEEIIESHEAHIRAKDS